MFGDSPLAELSGIWDGDAERGKLLADVDALLAACDAVAVCSPTAYHAGLIERAVAADCARAEPVAPAT